MAFKNKNMSVLAYANGWTLWHYETQDDTMADILKDDYFTPVYTLMNPGDFICIVADGQACIKYITEMSSDYVKLGALSK